MRQSPYSSLFLLIIHFTSGLRFMPDTFKDITAVCGRDGKFPMFLDVSTPAINLRLDEGSNLKRQNINITSKTLDCDIEIQTVLRQDGDKEMLEMEALSLVILELNFTDSRTESVQVITNSYFGQKTVSVTQEANYGTNRIWTNNPTFLLSGQLTGGLGFETIDNRHRARHYVHEQHVFPPDRIFSKFDTPASIQVRLRRWNLSSRLYLVFTSYKLLNNGESCTDTEFECPTSPSFRETTGRLCMSFSLACNGLPNCGDNQIPNPDESCYKIHWSSILMSLVSYILLAITLLLCMSCFARILIQWSVRSSLYDLRTDSTRSSSRFFSFFGGSFTRWERPPPTYNEALKHFNPDTGRRPPDPPPYSDSFRPRLPLSRSLQAIRSSSFGSGIRTPPPDYSSCEDIRPRIMLREMSSDSAEAAQEPFLGPKYSEGTLPKYRPSTTLTRPASTTLTRPVSTTLTRTARPALSGANMASPGGGRPGRNEFQLVPSEKGHSDLVRVRRQHNSSLSSGLPIDRLGDSIESVDRHTVADIGHFSSELKIRRSSTLKRKDVISATQQQPPHTEVNVEHNDSSSMKKVVRTSQSGLIPDLPIPDPVQGSHPGPLVGISNLIPDTVDLINPELTRRSKLQNRTSKSGLLFDPPEYSESLNSLLGTPPSALPEANSGRRKDEEGRRKEDDGRRVKDKKADDINLKSFIHTSS